VSSSPIETTMLEHRAALRAFSRALERELHILQSADLQALPAFVFWQLQVRMQWTLPEGRRGGPLRRPPAAARRAAPLAPPPCIV
jgi:hypothetical protein